MHLVCCCNLPVWKTTSLKMGATVTYFSPALHPSSGSGEVSNVNCLTEESCCFFVLCKIPLHYGIFASLLLDCSVGVRVFCHRIESDLFLFLLLSTLIPSCSVERCNKVPRAPGVSSVIITSFEFWLCFVLDSFTLRNLCLTSFGLFCGCRGFCHRIESVRSLPFSLT